jgi:anaerobic selenocysteine-containing dehydrogenase
MISLYIMARYRQYKVISGLHCIQLKPSDVTDLNIKDGDYIDIEEAVKKTSISEELFEKMKLGEAGK